MTDAPYSAAYYRDANTWWVEGPCVSGTYRLINAHSRSAARYGAECLNDQREQDCDRVRGGFTLGMALHALPLAYLAGEVFGHGIPTGVAAGLYSLGVMLLCRHVARV